MDRNKENQTRDFKASHLPALLRLHVAVRRQQGAEAQQRQVHGWTRLLPLGPPASGATGRWEWGWLLGFHGVRVVVVVMVVVVVEVRGRDAAAAAAANQEGPPAVSVVQKASYQQKCEDEGAEQEEQHVHTFSLGRQAGAATCRETDQQQGFISLIARRPGSHVQPARIPPGFVSTHTVPPDPRRDSSLKPGLQRHEYVPNWFTQSALTSHNTSWVPHSFTSGTQ